MNTTLRDELQAIYNRVGRLTPALVVEVARDPHHPLHQRFNWDDTTAADSWRQHQAHELIRSVRVVYRERTDTEDERSVRAFQAVRADVAFNYVPTERVVEDPFLAKLVLSDMEREWRVLKRRYEAFREFWEMVQGDWGERAA